MTITDYATKMNALTELTRLPDGETYFNFNQLMDTTHIWSSDACMGYCINAAKNMGMTDDAIKTLVHELRSSFDRVSIEQAEEIYEKS